MEEEFWAKVDRSGECWTWNGPRRKTGEPLFWYNRRIFKAHRLAYELQYGVNIAGHQLRHTCGKAFCVKPEHCEIVVEKQEARRSNRPAPPTLEERFWTKVIKSDGCWEWAGFRFPTGYGSFRYKNRNEYAHRVSYILTHGAIPEGLLIRHTCDTPPCVNPNHLEVGTYTDNAQDRSQRGRNGKRTRIRELGAPKQKLTWAEVCEIRRIYREGTITKTDVGRIFGVAATTAMNIINNKTRREA